jgi:hypothetical protein
MALSYVELGLLIDALRLHQGQFANPPCQHVVYTLGIFFNFHIGIAFHDGHYGDLRNQLGDGVP